MPRGRPLKPKVDGSNLQKATWLEIYDEAVEAKSVLDSARGKYQAIFKRAEGLGINRAMLSLAIKLADQDRDRREGDYRDMMKYMSWLEMPLGAQGDLDLGEAPTEGESDESEAVVNHRLAEAEREGFDAGKIGADLARSNPYPVGSEAAQRYSTGWHAGQAEAVGQMGAGKRGRGRPRSANGAAGATITAPATAPERPDQRLAE